VHYGDSHCLASKQWRMTLGDARLWESRATGQEKTEVSVKAILTQPSQPSAETWLDCYDRYRDFKQNRVRDNSLGHALSRIGIAERILEDRRQDQGLPEGGPVADYMTLDGLEYLQDRLLAGDESRFDSRAPTTVNTMVGAVMTFVRYCHAHGWISDVPRVQKLDVDDVMKGRPISQAEFDAMVEAVPEIVGQRSAPSWVSTLKVLWESAFRVGDVMSFSWDDQRRIHPIWPNGGNQRPTLMIPSTQKNGKAQEIPMLPGLRDLLEEVPETDRYGWVVNPQPIDYQVRSREDWFRPPPSDLSELAGQYGNSAIARACGVTETAVRKWLAQDSVGIPSAMSRSTRDIPMKSVPELRQRAEQHRAQMQIASCRRLTKEHVGRVISRIGTEAGIVVQQEDPETGRRLKYASAHDIRRGCAKRLINAGISAETLKVIMRHHDFATTEKFYGATRAAQSAAAEVYDKLESADNTPQQDSPPDASAQLSSEEVQKLKALLNSI
jgi:integrase